MLRLERIDLAGFKSFVDGVGLNFHGGVTAIVGPNGCGKSNISDAITWVLGEQSAKSLRGDRMEDVIFTGSERRAPLGMAEVTMTLATDPSFEHAEEGRITISRRVFRSGESQYRINGKHVRLKDVKDLLMDTGLGIRAYSVIEQGKIGMILSGKPQERRRLLEEAAGVTRYKTRKRVAELKLEEASANLLRLDDIVAEVERAMRSLKRQASAAERYKEREAEYRELLVEVMTGRWRRLQSRLADLAARLAAAGDQEAALAAGVARDEAEVAAGRETLESLAKALADEHERHTSLGARIEGRQEFLKDNRANRSEVGERIAASLELAAGRETEMGRQREGLASLAGRRLELDAELEAAKNAAGEGRERLASAEEQLAATGARLEERRRELFGATAEGNGLRSRLQQEQIELERRNFRQTHLAGELERYSFEVRQSADQLEVAREAVAALERAVSEKETELESAKAAVEASMRDEASATERRRAIEAELGSARQRRQVLEELAEAHSRGRAGLEEALAAAGIAQPVYLEERLAAAAGWERSLDFYLGGLADAVLLGADAVPMETGAAAFDAGAEEPPAAPPPVALELARAFKAGRTGATLLTPLAAPPEAWPQVEDPAVALALGQALGLSPEVAAALPPAYLVDRAADAERLARRHPGVAFISPDGVWAQGGLVHVEGREALPGVLERERELADLGARLPGLELALAEAIERLEATIEERSRRASHSHRVEGELNQLRQESAVATARRQDAEGRHRRLAEELGAVTDERAEGERQLHLVIERRGAVLSELERCETRLAELQAAFDLAQRDLDAAKGDREDLRADTASRQGRLELLSERLASHDREARRLEQEIADGERQVKLWRDEAERLARRRAELEEAIARAEGELQAFLEERASSEDAVLAAQARLDDGRAAVRRLEERIASTRLQHDEARSAVEELRVTQAGARQEAEHLAGAFREQLGQEAPAEPGEVPFDLVEMEADLARRKEVLERMGPVNALAVEEYAEQEQRFTFLTTQRADVVASIDSLRKTIREINQASSVKFRETFEQVNRTFGEVFTRLFRGGEAEMRLLDEEDLLESGIEIVARPPGKRLQNIMLMSGGEKALTAIALLFALFKSKPSPFCILDEVDAPLDDANALRFVELLKELTGETQFIVITHNKLTMEIAGTLYGVTMEERGVSKVVTVELDDVQPAAQRATA